MRTRLVARHVSYATLDRLLLQAVCNRNNLITGMLLKGDQGDIEATFEVVRKLSTPRSQGRWHPLLDVLKEVTDILNRRWKA